MDAPLVAVARSILAGVAADRRLAVIGELLQAVSHDQETILSGCLSADDRTRFQTAYAAAGESVDLGEWYQALLDETPSARVGRRTKNRRATGCYYTPPELVAQVLDAALTPILAGIRLRPDAAQRLLELRLIDPACGSGRFLIAAARQIARAMTECSELAYRDSLRQVIERCIIGIDIDPIAVELCRLALARELDESVSSLTFLNETIRCADSLSSDVPRRAFDLVVGNPPFVNMIDGGLSPAMKRRLQHGAPELDGTADLAFHFVKLADEIAHSAGVVALVLPRTFLNAPAAARLRARLSRERPPSAILVSSVERQIRGAATYLCAVVLGGASTCLVDLGQQPSRHSWPVASDPAANWWRTANELSTPRRPSISVPGPRLGDCFQVTAGMTAGEAYAIRDHVRDEAEGTSLRLITSRLIDPDCCRWGAVPCRHLGATFAHPRLPEGDAWPAALRRRLIAARRPKLILAGLCRRFEAYLDDRGTDVGSVATFVVYHAEDDRQQLAQLRDWLHGPQANDWLRDELGAASVGHGYMTLKKRALQQLSLPADRAWSGAAHV